MTTPKAPVDDIIELTDIVEEGIALDLNLDGFPTKQPGGTKSLDEELDELLGGSTQDLPATTDPASTQPTGTSSKEAVLGDDLALDDIFDALQADSDLDSPSSLDALLDSDAPIETENLKPASAQQEEIMSPDTTGHKDDQPLQDLSSEDPELLSDNTSTPAPSLATHLEDTPSELETIQNTDASSPAEDIQQAADISAQNQTHHELEAQLAALPSRKDLETLTQELVTIQNRVLALENTPAPDIQVTTAQILAALPQSTKQLPFAQSLCDEVLGDVEAKLQGMPSTDVIEDLLQQVGNTQERVLSLENRPDPVLELTTDQLLSALPQSIEHIPFAQALHDAILNELETKLQAIPPTEILEDLLQQVGNTQERLSTLENKPDPVLEINTNQILSALPQTTEQIPFAQSFHNEILNDVEERFQALIVEKQEQIRDELTTSIDQKLLDIPSSSSVAELAQLVSTLQASISDLSGSQAQAKGLSAQVQVLETELATIRSTLQQQEAEQAALQEKNSTLHQEIQELKEDNRLIRQELAALVSPTALAEHMATLKQELHDHIQTQVPVHAAKIIREEIEHLVQDMSEDA